jgi:hypothetical protein
MMGSYPHSGFAGGGRGFAFGRPGAFDDRHIDHLPSTVTAPTGGECLV